MSMDRFRSAEPWHLTSKVILLLLAVLALGLGLVYFQKRGNPAPLLLFNLAADAMIGLVMGLGSRVLFQRRPWPIKALVSAALSIVGLAFLGSITASQSGIGPLRMEMAPADWLAPLGLQVRLPALPRSSATDSLDAAHMLVAVDVSWLALRAWKKRAMGRDRGRPAPAAAPVISEPSRASSQPMRAHAASVAPVRATSNVRSRPMVKPMRMAPVVARPGGRGGRTVIGRRRNLLRRRSAVQIATYEEHRCPYCLQDIKRDDLRASVECPVCHTLHHKDCWDITGTCQVPHLNG